MQNNLWIKVAILTFASEHPTRGKEDMERLLVRAATQVDSLAFSSSNVYPVCAWTRSLIGREAILIEARIATYTAYDTLLLRSLALGLTHAAETSYCVMMQRQRIDVDCFIGEEYYTNRADAAQKVA